MKVVYARWHNNYDLTLGKNYEAQKYKAGWLLIGTVLYREECFDIQEVYKDAQTKNSTSINQYNM